MPAPAPTRYCASRSSGLSAGLPRTAVLLAALSAPVFRGPEMVPVPVAVAVSALSVWMAAAGVWVMRRAPAPSGLRVASAGR